MCRTLIFRGQRAEGGGQKSANSESGFTLAALLVILTIMLMIIAFTVPEQWSMVMGRERDRQTIFLMKQYARAIMTWQKKNGGVPTSLDQLADARKPRVIRGKGKWPCPITGKEDDWILVPIGAIQQQPNPNPQQRPQTAEPSKLRKEASPDDYIGPFVGVRPRASGKSFISLNGAEDYSEWVYTMQDLELEINARTAMLTAK
jgi:type II secretory pathway pseudopilin PulG